MDRVDEYRDILYNILDRHNRIPFSVLGDASANDEQRYCIIGYSLAPRLLLTVYVERGQRTRIISARLATKAERRLYENP